MYKLKYTIFLTLLIFSVIRVFPQSNPKLSNYEFSPLTFNPAYAGSDTGITISSVYSTQWVGFEGAPETHFFAVHSMINSKIGLGLDFVSDKIGASNETKLLGNFSYKIQLSENWNAVMGIKTGFNIYNFDFTAINIQDPNEIGLISENKSSYNLNFGTGLYLYNNNYFLGLSVPNLVESKFYDSENNLIGKSTPHYYINTGYGIFLGDNLTFWPTILFRLAKGAPISSLVNLNSNWKNKFFLSINFDPNTSVGGYFGLKILDKFVVGYSYENSINYFDNYNNGNHSIFFKIKLNRSINNYQSPCYSIIN